MPTLLQWRDAGHSLGLPFRLHSLGLLCAATLLVGTPPLLAQTWTGGTSTTWSTAGNWSGGVPGNTATATFSSDTFRDPNLTAAATVGRLLFLSGTDAEIFTGSNLTLNGVSGVGIDNQSGVTHTFNNTLVVNAAQTWNAGSGNLVFSAVTLASNLTLTGSAGFTFGGTFLNSGGNRSLTNNATGSVGLSGNVSLSNNNTSRTLTFGGAGDTLVSGNIGNGGTGAGSIIKSGTGTLTLSGANTYTGTTVIGSAGGATGGTLRLGAANNLANNTTTVFAGTLDLNGFNDTIGALNLGGGAAGTTAAVTTGAGTLTLGGNLTYSATNNANGATLSGNLNLGGANRTFTIGDSSAVADDVFLSATIAGANAITKAGTGTLVFSGANTYTGNTSVTAGILNIRHASALGTAAAGTTVSTGAQLQLQGGIAVGTEALSINGTGIGNSGALRNISGNNSWAGAVTLAGNTRIVSDAGLLNLTGGLSGANRTLTVAGAGDLGIAGNINLGSGGLIKLDSSTLTLAGTNSGTGATTIGATGASTTGTLRLGASNGLASGAVTVFSGTLDLNGYNDSIGALTLGAGAAGTTATVTTGAGTLTLGGNLTYSATNNANGATLSGNLNLGGANRTFTIGDSSAVADDVFLSATIAGANAITKAGTGTLVFSGANTYTGNTSVTAGILNIRHASALGTAAAGTTVSTGAQLQLQGGIAVGNEALSVAGTGVNASGALRNISGDNSWAGLVTLTNTTQITADAGTLTLTGGISGANRTLTLTGAGNLSISAITTGTGSLNLNGTGTTTLTGASTFTGATNLNAGTLVLGTSDALSDLTALTVAAGATFSLATHSDTIASLAGGGTVDLGTGSLATAGNANTVFSGTLDGTGTFTKGGTGSLTLTNDFTFDGTFNLAGGTLRLSDMNLTLGTLNITGNSIIDFAGISSLNLTHFNLSGGVSLTVQNWANASDYFFTQFWTGATLDTTGAAPMNQITFTGFSNNDTKWQAYDNQITPVPEPSAYGALLLAVTGGLLAWRRRRLRRNRGSSLMPERWSPTSGRAD